MQDKTSRAHRGRLIDPPSTTAPLAEWQQFLASMQSKPQENKVFRELTEHAAAVVAWKTSGEKGAAPERKAPPAPQAPWA
jgi:hypothetical protein